MKFIKTITGYILLIVSFFVFFVVLGALISKDYVPAVFVLVIGIALLIVSLKMIRPNTKAPAADQLKVSGKDDSSDDSNIGNGSAESKPRKLVPMSDAGNEHPIPIKFDPKQTPQHGSSQPRKFIPSAEKDFLAENSTSEPVKFQPRQDSGDANAPIDSPKPKKYVPR